MRRPSGRLQARTGGLASCCTAGHGQNDQKSATTRAVPGFLSGLDSPAPLRIYLTWPKRRQANEICEFGSWRASTSITYAGGGTGPGGGCEWPAPATPTPLPLPLRPFKQPGSKSAAQHTFSQELPSLPPCSILPTMANDAGGRSF